MLHHLHPEWHIRGYHVNEMSSLCSHLLAMTLS